MTTTLGRAAISAAARRRRLARRLAPALLACTMGCAQPPESGEQSTARPVGPAPPGTPMAANGPGPSQRIVVSETRWPPVASIDAAARAALAPASLEAVERAKVPVLVVDREQLLAHSIVMAKEHWYALSAAHDGITVGLRATRLAHRYPHIPPMQGRHRVRGKAAFLTQNAGIWSVSWNERGAAYTLEVECASHADARCHDGSFVTELASSLAYVGGAGQGGP